VNKREYLAYHRDACERMIAITQAKNADYTGEGDNPFANFTRVEALGITDTPRGFLVRMTDKMSRITSFVQKGVLQVKDESVEDTLFDLANYCILLAAFIKSKKGAPNACSSDASGDGDLAGWPHNPDSERVANAVAP
jgi:hypothetical protein